MINLRITKTLFSALAVMGSVGAFAQTNTNSAIPPMASSSAPKANTTVGVTQKEASKAMKEAVPRNDVATVVRTEEASVNNESKTAGTSRIPSETKDASIVRKARADRN